MKKLFLALAVLVALLILAFGAHAMYVLKTLDGAALDKESKAWVDRIGPKILESWDPKQISTNASSQMIQNVQAADLKTYTDNIREQLGALTKYSTSTGESGIHVNNFSTTITAEYVIEADFTKGHGRVFIQGLKQGEEWKLLTIHVDTDPNLRWDHGHLTTQPPLAKPGDTHVVNGTAETRVWNW